VAGLGVSSKPSAVPRQHISIGHRLRSLTISPPWGRRDSFLCLIHVNDGRPNSTGSRSNGCHVIIDRSRLATVASAPAAKSYCAGY
jgi:hypothetical protein